MDTSDTTDIPSTSTKERQNFEFTKRRKWADILIAEIPSWVFTVKPEDQFRDDTKVRFSNPACLAILGWSMQEICDSPLVDFVHPEDADFFKESMQNSLSEQAPLSGYFRFQSKTEDEKDPEYVLIEMRGHAQFVQGSNGSKCENFFLIGRKFPEAQQAIIETFLELKIESERLCQRLQDLRSIAQSKNINTDASNIQAAVAGTSSLQIDVAAASTNHSPQLMSDGTMKNETTTPSSAVRKHALVNNNNSAPSDKRTRLKTKDDEHVCVTCGRNDSPEWRKGPMGPKTLCNACGLRYAKRNSRKVEK